MIDTPAQHSFQLFNNSQFHSYNHNVRHFIMYHKSTLFHSLECLMGVQVTKTSITYWAHLENHLPGNLFILIINCSTLLRKTIAFSFKPGWMDGWMDGCILGNFSIAGASHTRHKHSNDMWYNHTKPIHYNQITYSILISFNLTQI